MSRALVLSTESWREAWAEALPVLSGGVVSEESFPLSEMLAGEDAVMRAGKGSTGGRVLGVSVVVSPVTSMGDGRRRQEICQLHRETYAHLSLLNTQRIICIPHIHMHTHTHTCTPYIYDIGHIRVDAYGVCMGLQMDMHVCTCIYTNT